MLPAQITQFESAIAHIETIQDGLDLRATGETLLTMVRAHKLGVWQHNNVLAKIIKLEAKLGRMLNEEAPHGGARGVTRHLTLEELGVTAWQSKRWREMAEIDEQDIDAVLQHCGDQQLMSRSTIKRLHTESRNPPPEWSEEANWRMLRSMVQDFYERAEDEHRLMKCAEFLEQDG